MRINNIFNDMKNFSTFFAFLAFCALTISVSCSDKKLIENPEKPNFVGTATVEPTKMTLPKTKVNLIFSDDQSKVDIEMLQVTFANGMPVMDLTVAGVTAEKLVTGEWKFAGNDIIPTGVIMGVPSKNPNYTITNLTGGVDETGNTLTFSMKAGTFTISYDGTAAK